MFFVLLFIQGSIILIACVKINRTAVNLLITEVWERTEMKRDTIPECDISINYQESGGINKGNRKNEIQINKALPRDSFKFQVP